MLTETRDMAEPRWFFAQALKVAGQTPWQSTIDEHGAYPRAIRATLGRDGTHRSSRHSSRTLPEPDEYTLVVLASYGTTVSVGFWITRP